MRLIGTLEDEHKALAFSHFLTQKGISHQIEVEKENDWGNHSYGTSRCKIWIENEEQFEDASRWLELFIENPLDPIFQITNRPTTFRIPIQPLPTSPSSSKSSPQSISSWEKQPMGWITRTLLAFCGILFLLSELLMPSVQVPEQYAGLVLFTSPVEKTLLFDYPKFYERVNAFVRQYGYEDLDNSKELPPEGKRLLQQINQTPFWPGYYQLLLKEGWQTAKKGLSDYPTFEKIREGQVWRLFSPCLLHADLFHIFFNMMWLMVLGKQIEQRLSPWRYILFILIIGVISNIAQYLMSGPNFIGFSGVLCGMLAFIWMRQKKAPWEGYQIDKMTLIFMLVFIIGMASIQLLSFVLEKSFDLAFSPNIANMAHLAGGMMGFLFGSLNFFSWRHR